MTLLPLKSTVLNRAYGYYEGASGDGVTHRTDVARNWIEKDDVDGVAFNIVARSKAGYYDYHFEFPDFEYGLKTFGSSYSYTAIYRVLQGKGYTVVRDYIEVGGEREYLFSATVSWSD